MSSGTTHIVAGYIPTPEGVAAIDYAIAQATADGTDVDAAVMAAAGGK